jgi:hypothetical protein
MILSNDKCNIIISVDHTYTVDSADNRSYDLVINPCQIKHNDFYKTFSIKIDLFYTELNIALVGDLYSYESDCAILDDEVLTVLQNNTIAQISIVDGSLIRFKKLGCFGCNFGIYKVQRGYIIYGEIEITMLDLEFNKEWQFSGSDIFVSCSGKRAFELCEKSIKLYDFEDNYYEIDFNGKMICED